MDGRRTRKKDGWYVKRYLEQQERRNSAHVQRDVIKGDDI